MVTVTQIEPGQADAQRLIKELDAYQLSIYPEESNHLDSVEALSSTNVYFVGAYKENDLLGIGAVKLMDEDCRYGEIKRVYVSESARGLGISKAIMSELENHVLESGVNILRLETGIHQPEAIGLYEKLGYAIRDRFGDYPDDPLSVFMQKVF